MIHVQDVLEYLPFPDDFDPERPPPGEYGRRLMLRWWNAQMAINGVLAQFDPHARLAPDDDGVQAARYVLAAWGFAPALLLRYGAGNAADFIGFTREVLAAGDGASPYDLASWGDDVGQAMLDLLVLGMSGLQRAHAALLPRSEPTE